LKKRVKHFSEENKITRKIFKQKLKIETKKTFKRKVVF